MFDKGLFGGMFDFNNDGKMDSFEKAAEFTTFMHIMEESEKTETTESFGSVYSGTDEPDEIESALSDIGLDMDDLELMDDDERYEALEDAGLDPDDFDF